MSASSPATSDRARRRRPSARVARSRRSVAAPASSDSRPEAARRISSIWNMRSRACTNPSAVAASASDSALIHGMPSASKVTVAVARRPGTAVRRSRCGNDHQIAPATATTAMTTSASRPIRIRLAQRQRTLPVRLGTVDWRGALSGAGATSRWRFGRRWGWSLTCCGCLGRGSLGPGCRPGRRPRRRATGQQDREPPRR